MAQRHARPASFRLLLWRQYGHPADQEWIVSGQDVAKPFCDLQSGLRIGVSAGPSRSPSPQDGLLRFRRTRMLEPECLGHEPVGRVPLLRPRDLVNLGRPVGVTHLEMQELVEVGIKGRLERCRHEG